MNEKKTLKENFELAKENVKVKTKAVGTKVVSVGKKVVPLALAFGAGMGVSKILDHTKRADGSDDAEWIDLDDLENDDLSIDKDSALSESETTVDN